MSKQHYDYFVIGAGSGGVRSARIAATHGAKVAIAEGSNLGGTCVNLGCIPKKLLAYGADYGYHMEDARGFGWNIPENITLDWPKLIENKNKEISRLNGIYKSLLETAGVELFNGYAAFEDANTLSVNGQHVSADKILIAVGGTPRRPKCEGASLMATSDDVFHWPRKPENVVIQGGGYIAVEFAHIFHGLGAHVTLLYRGELFLRGFDRDIAAALAEEMRKSGIDLRFNTDVAKVEQNGNQYTVHTNTGETLKCDLPITAIGRNPNIEKLNLDNAGISLAPNGQIAINENYQTSAAHIYALGDVANNTPLTPVAIQEGHVLADRLFGNMPERAVNYDNIATAVFSAPPIGTVGLSEEAAREQGFEPHIYESGFQPLKHKLSGRNEKTLMKLVVDAKTDKVLGAHMMGMDAPEVIQGIAIAMNMGATKADFDRTMAVHPTSAEEFVLMRTRKS
ncbi:MAG: glutathione-disulfide reductase [Alphaproteobacteria bacterium]